MYDQTNPQPQTMEDMKKYKKMIIGLSVAISTAWAMSFVLLAIPDNSPLQMGAVITTLIGTVFGVVISIIGFIESSD